MELHEAATEAGAAPPGQGSAQQQATPIWRIAQASIADATDSASRALPGVRGQGISFPDALGNTSTGSMLVFWVKVSGL